MKDYKALNLAMSKRRGECPECQKATCACQKKTAAINPSIRATGEESAANGSDVQTELLRNPFEGPTGNPAQASDFENGYQNAQSLGHLQIAQAQPAQIQAWAKDSPAWRAGFAQAARTMGCGNVAIQINPTRKVAHMNLISLPTHANDKIASALGTLAGGLMGAGVGAGIGHMMPADFVSDHDRHLQQMDDLRDTVQSSREVQPVATSTPGHFVNPFSHEPLQPTVTSTPGHFLRPATFAPSDTLGASPDVGEVEAKMKADGAAEQQHRAFERSEGLASGQLLSSTLGAGAGALAGGALGHAMTRDKQKQAEYFEAAFKR